MAAAAIRDARRSAESLAATIRLRDWWDYKLSPLLAIFWGVALGRGAALLPLTGSALALIAAIGVCAVFVSVLNDITDVSVDRLAGKANRMGGRSAAARALLVGIPALIGLAIAAAWSDDPALCAAYVGAFAAFSAYSLPPLRLKCRGALGAIADAAGAHLFPTLTAVLLACASIGVGPDPLLLAAAATWALALGLRGILWHQLADVEADERASVRTLPRSMGSERAARLGERVVFPAELAALGILLWWMEAAAGFAFLVLHLGVLYFRARHQGVTPAVVRPRAGAVIALHEYYAMWLPAAIILQSALHHPEDLLLLPLLAVLFRKFARQAAGEIWRMLPPARRARRTSS